MLRSDCIPVDNLVTISENLTADLRRPDFFEVETHPMLTFRSISIAVGGISAKIDAAFERAG